MTNIVLSLHCHADNILLYDILFYNLPIAPHSIFTIYQLRRTAFLHLTNCAAWHFNNLPIAPHGIFYNLTIAWYSFDNLFLLKSNAFFVLAS